MLNRIVSPSCKPFNAATKFVSFGPGLTLLAVLTVMTAAWVTAQNSTSVTVEKWINLGTELEGGFGNKAPKG